MDLSFSESRTAAEVPFWFFTGEAVFLRERLGEAAVLACWFFRLRLSLLRMRQVKEISF